MGLSQASLKEGLRTLVRREVGPDCDVGTLGVMEEGHAGLTYGFDVVDGSGASRGEYVIKLAPVGVTRRGNTDVFRQGRLLRALHAAGLKVPAVPWASAEDEPLGTPFFVMEKLPGRVFVIWEPHPSFSRDPADIAEIWRQAARMLAELHKVPWQRVLGEWEQPRPLLEEVQRWSGVLKHATEPHWLSAGRTVEARLLATVPAEDPVGLVHGDYQPANLLFRDRRIEGVIDWELASIGAQGLDVGWLLMMADPECWDARWKPLAGGIPLAEIVAAYHAAGGPAREHIDWFEAFSAYRMAAIACLNVKLHRTGKRPDELWERFAPSISSLFARAANLLGVRIPPEGATQ